MSSSRAVALLCFVLFTACPAPKPPPAPEPGPLQAGVATRRLDLPVGIAMGGYLRQRPVSDPGSNWAEQFPASQGIHTEPTVRVVALTNGLTRVALIRLDATITSPTLRSRLVGSLTAAGESANVFMYATHSHAAPARFMPPARLGSATGTDFVSLVMDHYDAEAETRMTSAIVAAITEAFSTLKPVSLGVASVEAGDFNNDRRCENDPIYGPDFRDTALTVIRIDEVDASGQPVKPLTALLHYAMHGTVLGSDNTLQSTEGPGAFELYASDALGIPAMYVQGAAGDVSPRGDSFHHSDLQQLERQGRAEAALAKDAWARATPGPAAAKARLDFRERGVLVTREAIGYAKGEFPEYGGIQCSAGGPGPCGAVVSTPKDVFCLPLEPRKPFKTALSMLRVGDVLLFSLPGEPGTGLSRKMVSALAPLGATTVLTVGYAQDHYGYLLEADDWLRGGYEPTVSAYGWLFGPYLLAQLTDFAATWDSSQEAADLLPVPPATSRPIIDALSAPAVVTQPIDGARLSTHLFQFEGGDPSLGTPQVSLEKQEGAAFLPVHASPTRVVINGPELMLRYAATPTFKAEPDATSRRHLWSLKFETVPSTELGTYRLVARGSTKVAGAVSTYELISGSFVVSKSREVGGVVAGRITADQRFAVEVRFPPNPTTYVEMGHSDPSGNYRVRDMNSDPNVGALVRSGATAMGTLTAPDNSTSTVTLAWSDTEMAWVTGGILTAPGNYRLELVPGALVDAWGNDNGATLSMTATR
jgi:neutral ceramidase